MIDPSELTTATVHMLAQGHITRVWGPPGCGKTTDLADKLRKTVAQWGPQSAVVVSFTHTAAAEIASRDTGLPDTQVGTLHSLAFRAVGTPTVALDPKVVTGWNRTHRPEWKLAEDSRRGQPTLTAEATAGEGGDALLSRYDKLRARFKPEAQWPAEVKRFATEWETWKREAGAIDFCDMIQMALGRALEGEHAPGDPKVLVADEAQDLTPLEFALLLAWGAWCDRLVLALDDDQAINAWRGGDATPILALGTGMDGEPQPGVTVEEQPQTQSHRVPSAIQTVASQWIEQVSTPRREKPYAPREVGGKIYNVGYTLFHEQTAAAIERDALAGRSVMVLASCQYMLLPMIKLLRQRGVPFGNAFRPGERAWNPLSTENGMSAAEKLYRYLRLSAEYHWTGDDIRAWLPLVESAKAGLMRGAKTMIKNYPNGEVPYPQVAGLWADGEDNPQFETAVSPSLEWILGTVLEKHRDPLSYPARVARRFGVNALVEPPKVTIGTIHSVKGGGAQCVYLSPSLSPAAYAQWERGGTDRDEVYRQFYVGLTRASESLVVLGSTECQVPRELLCPRELVRR